MRTPDDELPAAEDLDALIGGLRAEAARRRAAPAYPIDDEARIGLELDSQAPRPLPAPLERLAGAAARVETAAREQAAGGAGGAGGGGGAGNQPESRSVSPGARRARRARRAEPPLPQSVALAEQVAALAHTVTGSLRLIAEKLDDIDRRLHQLEHPGEKPPTAMAEGSRSPGPVLDAWRDQQ
jgi:hypothetical protein